IGKVNDQYFINIAGGGDLTELTYDVPIKMKAAIGQLAYYVKGIEMLPSLKPVHTRIEYDDNVFEGDMMLFLVANTNTVDGIEMFAFVSPVRVPLEYADSVLEGAILLFSVANTKSVG